MKKINIPENHLKAIVLALIEAKRKALLDLENILDDLKPFIQENIKAYDDTMEYLLTHNKSVELYLRFFLEFEDIEINCQNCGDDNECPK